MAVLIAFLSLLPAGETYKLTLRFEKMHCEECRVELEATLKKLSGYTSVSTGKETVLTLAEKAAVPKLDRLPKDLKLQSVTVTIRGTVSFKAATANLVAKGSGVTLALANPTKPKKDRLSELKKLLGGKNRFRITGTLVGGKKIIISAIEKADWKDK